MKLKMTVLPATAIGDRSVIQSTVKPVFQGKGSGQDDFHCPSCDALIAAKVRIGNFQAPDGEQVVVGCPDCRKYLTFPTVRPV